MKISRKLLVFTSLSFLLFLAFFTYNRLTDGFSLYQMKSYLQYDPQYEIAALEEAEIGSLFQILDQPYHYLGKGCQFYAFESECGKYVIKFLKQKHLRSYEWLRKVALPKKLRELAENKISRRQERVHNLFSSCKIAYEEMAEESGLCFIHLNKTPLCFNELTIKDKLGLSHKICLDNYEFILQKKGLPLKSIFVEINEEELKEKLSQLTLLIQERCQKGICDRDRSFVQNVAFSLETGAPMFVDVGQFYKDPAILSEEEQKKELQKRLGNLRYWTERNFPNLVSTVDESIKNYFQD